MKFENLKNKTALDNARKDHKDITKARQAKANIPLAFKSLIEEKDEFFIDIISEKVESLCGFKPEDDKIIEFLNSIEKTVPTPLNNSQLIEKSLQNFSPVSKRSTRTKERKKIKVTFQDGEILCYNKVANTLVEVIKKIGISEVSQLNIISNGALLISSERPTRAHEELGQNLFVSTHSSTQEKFNVLHNINDRLNLGLSIDLFLPK